MQRMVLALGACASLAGLLTGCSSDERSAPSTLPPVTSSVASSAAPTPTAAAATPVPKPPEADAFTSEGAAAFVRYYIDVINAAVATNNAQQLAALSGPDCDSCQNYLASIAKTVADRGHVESGKLSVLSAVAPQLEAGAGTVLLDFTATEFVSRTADGRELQRFPPVGKRSAELRCLRRGDSWIVDSFHIVNSGAAS